VKLGACGNVTVAAEVTARYAIGVIGEAPMFCGRRWIAASVGGPLGCVVVNVAPIVVAMLAAGTVIVPEYPPATGPNVPVCACVVLVVSEPDDEGGSVEAGVGVGVGPPPPPPPGMLAPPPPPPPPHAANAAATKTTANAGRTRSSNFMPS